MELDYLHKLASGVYVPIVKGKGFCPNPVAGKIPIWADGENNPSCIGTDAWSEFWDEQINRCINGYDTGGIHIPGRYYFFLNFMVLTGPSGPTYPFISDLDLEYFRLIDYIKQNNHLGLIIPKARRVGASELFKAVVNHGLRFIPDYSAGIAAGSKTYLDGLMKKIMIGMNRVPAELSLNVAKVEDNKLEIGYQERDSLGGFKKSGFGGTIKYETMHDRGDKLEGEYFMDVGFEEAGNFKRLMETFKSVLPAMRQGAIVKGTIYVFGTGDNILSSSQGFHELWEDADKYGLLRFFMPGYRKYRPFINIVEDRGIKIKHPVTHEEVDPLKNVAGIYDNEEGIGIEDTESAKEYIIAEREAYKNMRNRKRLKEVSQEFPITIEEVWISGGKNDFNDDLLYEQLMKIMLEKNEIRRYKLEWMTKEEEDGTKVKLYPLQVEAIPANDKDKDEDCVLIYRHPMPEYRNLDVQGVDGYNEDKTQTSDSLGGIVVLRQYNKVGIDRNIDGVVPVCVYYKRPARKEKFWDMSLKVSVYYGTVRNTMLSAESDSMIEYYQKNKCTHYLSTRPKRLESPTSQKVHPYGMKMDVGTKPRVLGLAQTWIEDNIQYCWYDAIVKDFLAYNTEHNDSDWDLADALMLALARIYDMKGAVSSQKEELNSRYTTTEWEMDERGNPKLKNDPATKEIDKTYKETKGGWVQINSEKIHNFEKNID
jgi:hypothetical protein